MVLAFIEVAEQVGLSKELDFQMRRQACRQMASWRCQLATESLSLSVTVTAWLLYLANFVELLLVVLH